MSTETIIFACILIGFIISGILYVVFGQVTVRKLRKRPETKNELGMEFASGWDILNVAGALALPRWLNRKLRSTPLSSLYADAVLLDRYTSTFDRILATVFYGLFMGSAWSMIVLMLLSYFGVFD